MNDEYHGWYELVEALVEQHSAMKTSCEDAEKDNEEIKKKLGKK